MDNTSNIIDDFRRSLSDVDYLMRKGPNSSACSADNKPSIVRDNSSDITAPLAFDVFWINQNLLRPLVENFSYMPSE